MSYNYTNTQRFLGLANWSAFPDANFADPVKSHLRQWVLDRVLNRQYVPSVDRNPSIGLSEPIINSQCFKDS